MPPIPFHRRILPWVFAITFVLVAPALVFYTAGYRWNPKKGIVERNGTLIVDTIPEEATLILNGKKHTETTPVTFQHLAPGIYTLKLEKEGYFSWEKNVRIEPERVTFVTDVQLWPNAKPEKISDTRIQRFFVSPKQNAAIALTEKNATILILDPDSGKIQQEIKTTANISPSKARWNASEKQVLLEDEDKRWVLNLTKKTLTSLPSARSFHWEENLLVGSTESNRIEIKPDGSIARKKNENIDTDQNASLRIQHTTTTDQWILKNQKNATQGLLLPPNTWSFYQTTSDWTLLNANKNWLWIQVFSSSPEAAQTNASNIHLITIDQKTKILVQNRNDVSIWLPNKNPELLFRHSEPIQAVAWYADGKKILIATKKEIKMFEASTQEDPIVTQLAIFETIQDATILKENLLISGTFNGQTGLWHLPLTRQTSIIPPLNDLR